MPDGVSKTDTPNLTSCCAILVPTSESNADSFARSPTRELANIHATTERPKVFISATTRDLGSYREEVQNALLTLGIFPIQQDNFGTCQGSFCGPNRSVPAQSEYFCRKASALGSSLRIQHSLANCLRLPFQPKAKPYRIAN